MKFSDIVNSLSATVLHKGSRFSSDDIRNIIAADLMSEALLEDTRDNILVTALNNEQTARTADIIDSLGIVLINSRQPDHEMWNLIKEMDIVCLSTSMGMYDSCIKLNKIIESYNLV
jgi:shikimate 5-dehydrogenase